MSIISVNANTRQPVTDASSIFSYVPNDIFLLICRYLDPKNVVRLASTSPRLYFLLSDGPLWGSFLHQYFRDSCANLKSEGESPSFFKRLKIADDNINACEYRFWTIEGHQDAVTSVVIDGDKLISGSDDGVIKIWDLKSRRELMTLNGNLARIRITCLIVYKEKLISTSWNEKIKIWNLENGQKLMTIIGSPLCVQSLIIHEDKLIAGDGLGIIKVWDLENGQELMMFNGQHNGLIKSIAANGDRIVSGSTDGVIKIWDFKNGEELQSFEAHEGSVTGVAIDGDKIISSSSPPNCKVKIWDLQSGQELRSFVGPKGGIGKMALCDGKLFLCSKKMEICDIRTQPARGYALVDAKDAWFDCCTFYNGVMAAGSRDHKIRIWDFNDPSLSLVSSLQKEQAVDELKQTLKADRGEDLPLFLMELGIVNKEACLQKLKCSPGHLFDIGICSHDDLEALGLFKHSFHFENLKDLSPETCDQPKNMAELKMLQDKAFARKEEVTSLLQALLDAVRLMAKEAEHGALFYETKNIWFAFQSELETYQVILNGESNGPKTFNSASYVEIMQKMNQFIDKFRQLECEHRIAILSNYVNQNGSIYKAWNELYHPGPGTRSLAALLKTDIAPKDFFRMGI